MDPVESIWTFLEQLFIARNLTFTEQELQEKIQFIKQNIYFITGLAVTPQKFNISVEGQAIGLELFYDPLLLCWKCNMTDALEQNILTDITMMAGKNICEGMNLKYRATNNKNEIIEQSLAIKGLFVTEPRGQNFDSYERGVESSKYAFSPDQLNNCPCAIVYFVNLEAAELYRSLINGEEVELLVDIEDLDYEIEVRT